MSALKEQHIDTSVSHDGPFYDRPSYEIPGYQDDDNYGNRVDEKGQKIGVLTSLVGIDELDLFFFRLLFYPLELSSPGTLLAPTAYL